MRPARPFFCGRKTAFIIHIRDKCFPQQYFRSKRSNTLYILYMQLETTENYISLSQLWHTWLLSDMAGIDASVSELNTQYTHILNTNTNLFTPSTNNFSHFTSFQHRPPSALIALFPQSGRCLTSRFAPLPRSRSLSACALYRPWLRARFPVHAENWRPFFDANSTEGKVSQEP